MYPNDELRKVYSSAKIVLCDHWDDMREHGFISNRIYDALACGATIVSDDVAGLATRFPGQVHTYVSANELRSLIDRQLVSPASPCPPQAGHTFITRVAELLECIGRHRQAPAQPSVPFRTPHEIDKANIPT